MRKRIYSIIISSLIVGFCLPGTLVHAEEYTGETSIVYGEDGNYTTYDGEGNVLETTESDLEVDNTLELTEEVNGYTIMLYDGAELFTESERNDLLEQEKEIVSDLNDVAYGSLIIYTTNENSYSGTRALAQEINDTYGSSNSVLLLVDMDNREIYIDSTGQMQNTVTSEKGDMITDNTYRYFSKAEYYTGMSAMLTQVGKTLHHKSIVSPMKWINNLFIASFLGFVIMFLYVLSKRAKKTSVKELENQLFVDEIDDSNLKLVFVKKIHHESSSSGGGGGHHSGGGHSGGGHGF
jgi:uncharacterized protein